VYSNMSHPVASHRDALCCNETLTPKFRRDSRAPSDNKNKFWSWGVRPGRPQTRASHSSLFIQHSTQKILFFFFLKFLILHATLFPLAGPETEVRKVLFYRSLMSVPGAVVECARPLSCQWHDVAGSWRDEIAIWQLYSESLGMQPACHAFRRQCHSNLIFGVVYVYERRGGPPTGLLQCSALAF
jgi:hypothetical protein